MKDNKKCRVFEFFDQEEHFQELEVEDSFPLRNLLNSDYILAFTDPNKMRIWIWIGKDCSLRMRFAASYLSSNLKTKFGLFGYRVTSVDEGAESNPFKIFLGIDKEAPQSKQDLGPIYKGTIENEKELESIKIEEILQILAKVELPEGFIRKMVIIKDILYLYIEKLKYYFGTNIRERCLIPLKKKVEDGPYLMESYIPRLLISFNKILMIELLQRAGNKK